MAEISETTFPVDFREWRPLYFNAKFNGVYAMNLFDNKHFSRPMLTNLTDAYMRLWATMRQSRTQLIMTQIVLNMNIRIKLAGNCNVLTCVFNIFKYFKNISTEIRDFI